MTKIEALLKKVKDYEHPACKNCPWNKPGMAFGVSCTKHHINWKKTDKADVLSIWENPGGTTPEHSGNLCGICNSLNVTDKSAQNSFDLMKAAIIGEWDYSRKEINRTFKTWYITNSTKHGVATSRFSEQERNQLKKRMKKAGECCSLILREEIDILRPKLIIANGMKAVRNLQLLGILKRGTSSMKDWADSSPYRIDHYYDNGVLMKVFCLYHTSAGVTNRTVSKLFNEQTLKEIEVLKQRHPNPSAINRFMEKYNSASYVVRRGMYVHLMYWMKLGEVVRGL